MNFYSKSSQPSLIASPSTLRKKHMKKHRIKNWFRNWLMSNDASDRPDQAMAVESANIQSEGMRFQLYKASGGYVIETTMYDHVKDRRHIKMYVITDDKDIGSELGKIITMEALRV